MQRWIKRTLVAVFGTAVLVGGLTACGTHRGGWSNMSAADSAKMRERMLERAGNELKLDGAQTQKLTTLAVSV
jgi:protein CpxP